MSPPSPKSNFYLENSRFLAFGFFALFFTSFGQTYVFAFMASPMRETFSLSVSAFNSIYAVGTLASSLIMIWLGKLIDDLDLRRFTVCTVLAMALACLVMGLAGTVLVFAAAMFLLRLTGQGLMMHIGFTSMARYFETERGRASAVASLGLQVAQAVFPLLIVALLAVLHWRQIWFLWAAASIVLVLPLMMWLLRGHQDRHARFLEDSAEARAANVAWSRAVLFKDPRFLLILPGSMALPSIMTGLMIMQDTITGERGWSPHVLANGLVLMSVVSVAVSFLNGKCVDLWGARRVLPFNLLPMAAGIAVLALFTEAWSGYLYMGLVGVTLGAAMTTGSAVWAEIYGPVHLGGVRAVTSAFMVFATAAGPQVMGMAYDAGLDMTQIAWWSVAVTLLSAGLIWTQHFLFYDFVPEALRVEGENI